MSVARISSGVSSVAAFDSGSAERSTASSDSMGDGNAGGDVDARSALNQTAVRIAATTTPSAPTRFVLIGLTRPRAALRVQQLLRTALRKGPACDLPCSRAVGHPDLSSAPDRRW